MRSKVFGLLMEFRGLRDLGRLQRSLPTRKVAIVSAFELFLVPYLVTIFVVKHAIVLKRSKW